MLAVRRFKGCLRCGGDLFEEPGMERLDRHVRYISCLLCGDVTYVEVTKPIRLEDLRGRRPGRPRKAEAG